MNVKPTVEIIKKAANELKYYAYQFEKYADDLEKTEDLNICGNVIQDIPNILAALRLDLLIIRPLREVEKFKERE